MTVFALSGVVGSTRQGLVIWFSDLPIFEMNFHIIIRNEPPIVERFYRHLLMYTEAGIPSKLKNYFQANLHVLFTLNTVYRTLEEFTADNSKFDQLTADNFRTLFITLLTLYVSFCFSALLIYLIRICSSKLICLISISPKLKQIRAIIPVAIRRLSDLDIKKKRCPEI